MPVVASPPAEYSRQTVCVTAKSPQRCGAEAFTAPGSVNTTADTITVHLERRAYTPVRVKATLPDDTRIPWLGNRVIRYELA